MIYSFYFWKKDVDEGYTNNPERYRDQEFQRIIYKLNQPYLRVNQSAFTNFTIFDRSYLEALFGDKAYPDGTYIIDYIDDIIEYQKAFMNVCSEIRSQNMMTFPVLTYSLLKKDGKFVDEDFAKWCCKHNMKWADSNFFISEDITSLSNCCFSGEQECLVKILNDPKTITFKELYDMLPDDGKNDIDIYHNGDWVKGKIIRLPKRPMYKATTINDKEIIVTDNHLSPTLEGDKPTTKLTTDDYLLFDTEMSSVVQECYAYIKDMDYKQYNNSIYYKIKSIEKIETEDEYVYCFEMENQDEPYFTLPNGIITHNCRLQSNIKELGYFNSIGGTALEVGSVKVNTINLARLAYENPKEKYMEALGEKVDLCLKVLDVIRHIIERNIEKGLLPNYTTGIMNLDNQYSTCGACGCYEVLQKYGMTYKDDLGYTHYTEEGVEFAKDILQHIHKYIDKFKEENGITYSCNIEQVPAERAATILQEKDKFFYPHEKYELPLYGNQWIPLGVKTTIDEKIKLSAILDKACNGGSIAHINLDAPFNNFGTAWDMLNKVSDAGVVYFAFCTRISACKHNHGFYGETCPICGNPKETTYQRIVGFLTPEKTYSKERKKEFRMRDWFELNRMSEM